MKKLMLVCFAFSLVTAVIALAQDTMKQGDDREKRQHEI
jgi:hypothetical protein